MATNRITTIEAEVLSTGAAPHARVTTIETEVLNSGAAAHARLTEISVEALVSIAADTTPHYIVPTTALEVASSGVASHAVVATEAAEVLNSGVTSHAVIATTAVEVLRTVEAHVSRAIDGSKIFEFEFTFQPETIFNEADYDSIYGVGDRVGNGLISGVFAGWDSNSGTPGTLVDDNWGLASGNSMSVGSSTGWPLGAFIAWQINGSENYLQITGIRFQGSAVSNPGWWGVYGGYDGVPWTKITLDFDQFHLDIGVTDPDGGSVLPLEFSSPFLPFNFFMISLDDMDTSGADFGGAHFGSEVLFKAYHSILDGGDRRSTNGRPAKRVTISTSSGIVADANVGDPFDNLLDGTYFHGNAGGRNKTTTTHLKRVGGTSGDDAITAAGQYIQFTFPRAVVMRDMVICAGDAETYTSGVPQNYGTWQWYASSSPTTGYVAIGDPWSFVEGSSWLRAPNPLPNPLVPADPWLFPYWRMVLVSGPAFGGAHVLGQVQFNLLDPDNASPIYTTVFTDDTSDALNATLTVIAGTGGGSGDVGFTDGTDDALNGTLTITNNPLLSAAFTDGDGDGINTWGSFYPSVVVQSITIIKGR